MSDGRTQCPQLHPALDFVVMACISPAIIWPQPALCFHATAVAGPAAIHPTFAVSAPPCYPVCRE